MADDAHQKITETVLKLAREQLRENGRLDFTVLTQDEQGREGRIDIDPEFFRSDATKDRLKRDLRQDFRKKGIIRYALVCECWMGQVKPIPFVPVRTENLGHYLSRYTDEYRRRGYSPRWISITNASGDEIGRIPIAVSDLIIPAASPRPTSISF